MSTAAKLAELLGVTEEELAAAMRELCGPTRCYNLGCTRERGHDGVHANEHWVWRDGVVREARARNAGEVFK